MGYTQSGPISSGMVVALQKAMVRAGGEMLMKKNKGITPQDSRKYTRLEAGVSTHL